MYKKQTDRKGFPHYETEQTSDQVLDRAFDWRKGTDTDVSHTFMRFGYHDPFKGRVEYEVLECADGPKLYRMTIDGISLLHPDEEKFRGWMTYDQLLCWIEGYNRLSTFEDFLQNAEEE